MQKPSNHLSVVERRYELYSKKALGAFLEKQFYNGPESYVIKLLEGQPGKYTARLIDAGVIADINRNKQPAQSFLTTLEQAIDNLRTSTFDGVQWFEAQEGCAVVVVPCAYGFLACAWHSEESLRFGYKMAAFYIAALWNKNSDDLILKHSVKSIVNSSPFFTIVDYDALVRAMGDTIIDDTKPRH